MGPPVGEAREVTMAFYGRTDTHPRSYACNKVARTRTTGVSPWGAPTAGESRGLLITPCLSPWMGSKPGQPCEFAPGPSTSSNIGPSGLTSPSTTLAGRKGMHVCVRAFITTTTGRDGLSHEIPSTSTQPPRRPLSEGASSDQDFRSKFVCWCARGRGIPTDPQTP